MIHDSPLAPVCKSRPIDGSARLTAVMSIPTSRTLTQQTASTTPRAELTGDGPTDADLKLKLGVAPVPP
jgi:hypothetical protein